MAEDRDPTGLGQIQQKELLRLAREAIVVYLETGCIPYHETDDPALTQTAGAFVTLKKRHPTHTQMNSFSLRGCIGYIRSDRPLYQVVQNMAIAAATADPRLPPVIVEELNKIQVEISVLSKLQQVIDLDQIQIGQHGLVMIHEKRRGVLLPQVPVERGWSRQDFLEHLCLKAGLPANYWTDERSIFYSFTTISFEE
jgi:AmmeMemoRadiSam system protein A